MPTNASPKPPAPESTGGKFNVPGAVNTPMGDSLPVRARQGSKTSFDVDAHFRALNEAKKYATAIEDYDKAGQLKKEIERFASVKVRLKKLMSQKDEAVAKEDYEEASFLKKEITEIIEMVNKPEKESKRPMGSLSSTHDAFVDEVMPPAGFVGGALPPAKSLEELASELDENYAPTPQKNDYKDLSPKAGKMEAKVEAPVIGVEKSGDDKEDDGSNGGPMDTDGEDLIKQVFDVLDEDSNGYISSEEARRFIDLTTVGLEESHQQGDVKDALINAFSKMDTNHDGEISYDEWRRGFAILLKVYKAEHIEGPMLDAIYQLDDSCC